MQYRRFGNTDLQVSVIGLGGHEFGEGGKIRGFQDDHKLAVQRGYIFDGFGQDNRRRIVARALDLGINMFDLTIDSEKQAMGRLLAELKPRTQIMIQTRPEGMVYGYDPQNRQMAQYDLLKTEVQRICQLIQRDHVDILNFAFMKDALDGDPDYLAKISDNIRRLKHAGLIRFASADTFSGEATYVRQFQTGAFDSTFINYNPTDRAMEDLVIPEANLRGMAILTRECFRKGLFFRLAEEAGITDRALIAGCGIKWCLRDRRITSVMLGVANADQLEHNVAVIESPELTDEEHAVLQAIFATDSFKKHLSERSASLKR